MVRSWSTAARYAAYADTYTGLLLTGALLGAVILLAGPQAVSLFFGPQYSTAGLLVTLLGFGIIGQSIGIATSLHTFGSTDLTEGMSVPLVVNCVGVLFALGGVAVGYVLGGIRGVAIGEAFVETATAALVYLVIARKLQIGLLPNVLAWLIAAAAGTAVTAYRPEWRLWVGAGIVAAVLSVTLWCRQRSSQIINDW